MKTKSDTRVSQLDVSKVTPDERRKLEREVLASHGDLLFSRALILFEGETEEQALPLFAESYWGATAHEKGYSFVGCGGANYFPFVWLANSFGISWYILCDGEDKTIARTNAQLKRIGLPPVDKLDNVSVIDGKADYEGHLIATGYMDAIETAFTAVLGAGYFEITRAVADANERPKTYWKSGRPGYPRLSRPPLWNLRMKHGGYLLQGSARQARKED